MRRLISPKLERETGIEPATNSLEGCDSTTELLPPSRTAHFVRALRRATRLAPLPNQFPWPANRSSDAARAAEERRLVAREGFEPSKPLGRQIYSLLRLTASLPRLNVPAPHLIFRRHRPAPAPARPAGAPTSLCHQLGTKEVPRDVRGS